MTLEAGRKYLCERVGEYNGKPLYVPLQTICTEDRTGIKNPGVRVGVYNGKPLYSQPANSGSGGAPDLGQKYPGLRVGVYNGKPLYAVTPGSCGCSVACDDSLLPSANLTMTWHWDFVSPALAGLCAAEIAASEGQVNQLIYGPWAYTDGRKEWHSEAFTIGDCSGGPVTCPLCFDFAEGAFALDFGAGSFCTCCFGVACDDPSEPAGYGSGLYIALAADVPFAGGVPTSCHPFPASPTGQGTVPGPYAMTCSPLQTSLGYSYLDFLGNLATGWWDIA